MDFMKNILIRIAKTAIFTIGITAITLFAIISIIADMAAMLKDKIKRWHEVA